MRLLPFAPIAIVAVLIASVSQAEAQALPSITISESDSGGLVATASPDFPFLLAPSNRSPESITLTATLLNSGSFRSVLFLMDAAGISDILAVTNSSTAGFNLTFTSDSESPLLPTTADFRQVDESTCFPLGCQLVVSIPISPPGVPPSTLSFNVFVLSDVDATVPEPATLILVGAGILASAGVKLRRRHRS